MKFAKTIKASEYAECSSTSKNDEIERLFVTAAKLGLGINGRQSMSKKGSASELNSEKSKCSIS